jgi:septum formation protein
VLASASPRRTELLRAAGYTFVVEVADIDESVRDDESPEAYVRRLAILKARAVAARHPAALVLGADTTVVVDGEILGKPSDAADAARMVSRLAGRAHLVHTAVAVALDGRVSSEVATTTVWFAPIAAAEIAAYVASGEPMDKAGAYGIQGGASAFVTRIEGAHDTVVGLPMAVVRRLLEAFSDAGLEDSQVGGRERGARDGSRPISG